MHDQLEAAFRRTRYHVHAREGELVLRVDQPSPALARLLRTSGARCAAILTAFNPRGRMQAPQLNRLSQRQLGRELRRRGYALLDGRNEDPRGHWPAEPTWLVFGLSLARAQDIASRYRQAAFVWCGVRGAPRLVGTAVRQRPAD
jgi:hypothetical protein